MSQIIQKINDLQLLRQLLTQDYEGLEKHLYSKLRIGDMWWIPDTVTNFGRGERHPWVIIVGCGPNHSPVVACPRTTKEDRRSGKLLLPANVLPELDKEGIILLKFRRTLAAERFREFDYIGRLPDEWIHRLRDSIGRHIGGTR